MTRLFIRFYVGVLAVLFIAWYIHGEVLQRRTAADTARVYEQAHGGGARLVARELSNVPPDSREHALKVIRERFAYPVNVLPLSDLPSSIQQRVSRGDDVAYYLPPGENRARVVAALTTGSEVVQLGPFPNYDILGIEESIGGWITLTAEKVASTDPHARDSVLKQLRTGFDFPIKVASLRDLSPEPQKRIALGTNVVFYQQETNRWYAATPLSHESEILRFGPFPNFEQIEQKAATTTLGLVLLPAALAIALLLRPVARQLRCVENAAKAVASGDLSARVDEQRVRAAMPLAQAFNNMAGRIETLVRTQRELLQAVSHELRTPLSRMRFAIGLIESAKDEAERKQRLESLDAATAELDSLVGELLSYVRMGSAPASNQRAPVHVVEAVDEWVEKQAGLYPSVSFEIGDGARKDEPVVQADRTEFERAIGNLLANAGRFARGRVVVSAQASLQGLILDVDDDGAGIPAEDRSRVLEPFVRLDESGRGAGLGLALVRRIVEYHGGGISILDSPLGGCRIRTVWPNHVSTSNATEAAV